MGLDTDLSAMTQEDAREYVVHFMTSLTQTRKQLTALDQECSVWSRRVHLATERGIPELAEKAQQQPQQKSLDRDRIAAEEAQLTATVETLRTQLMRLQTQPRFSVDADLLLAELQSLTGEPDKLKEAFKQEDLDEQLRELKRKLPDGQ